MRQLFRRMSFILTLAIALITLSSIPACGQKGPLFLPGNPSDIRAEPVEEEQEDEDEDDEEDDDSAPR